MSIRHDSIILSQTLAFGKFRYFAVGCVPLLNSHVRVSLESEDTINPSSEQLPEGLLWAALLIQAVFTLGAFPPTDLLCLLFNLCSPMLGREHSLTEKSNMKWILLTIVLVVSTPARAGIITLRSGNGSVGSTDSEVSMLVGPEDAPFGVAFTTADFASARSGAAASIVNPHPDWLSSLPSDSSAKWITTDPRGADTDGDAFGRSALYAIDFTLSKAVTSATLDLFFAVDNRLGDLDQDGISNGPNDGVFINGTAVSGSYRDGNFFGEFSLHRSDVEPLLHTGTNTLYLNATDLGGPSGIIFSATITTTPVPEPSSIALLGMGAVSLFGYGWRRKQLRRDK